MKWVTRVSCYVPLFNHSNLSFAAYSAHEALEKNRELISENQREYQKELERNFVDFKTELEPILGKKALARFARQKTCRKV